MSVQRFDRTRKQFGILHLRKNKHLDNTSDLSAGYLCSYGLSTVLDVLGANCHIIRGK